MSAPALTVAEGIEILAAVKAAQERLARAEKAPATEVVCYGFFVAQTESSRAETDAAREALRVAQARVTEDLATLCDYAYLIARGAK